MQHDKRTDIDCRQRCLIAFDLDDTLFKERDYLRSGHRVLAGKLAGESGADESVLFRLITENHPRGIEAALAYLAERGTPSSFSVDELVEAYRAHTPDISLDADTERTLQELKRLGHRLVLITDGSTRHQRAKLHALGLDRFIEPGAVLISEETGGDKHTPLPFTIAEERFGKETARRIYVGDNLSKDFRWPNQRGWTSVMLADHNGINVFPQQPSQWPGEYRPSVCIDNISRILEFV